MGIKDLCKIIDPDWRRKQTPTVRAVTLAGFGIGVGLITYAVGSLIKTFIN